LANNSYFLKEGTRFIFKLFLFNEPLPEYQDLPDALATRYFWHLFTPLLLTVGLDIGWGHLLELVTAFKVLDCFILLFLYILLCLFYCVFQLSFERLGLLGCPSGDLYHFIRYLVLRLQNFQNGFKVNVTQPNVIAEFAGCLWKLFSQGEGCICHA
jgi:hypothetical protein